MEGALAKLERVMPEALRERVRTLEETVITAAASPTVRTSGEIVAIMAAATRQ